MVKARAKAKVGKQPDRERSFDDGEYEDSEDFLDEAGDRAVVRGRRPRREMRERIEARDEERLLSRELSDWDSYEDEELD